MIKILVSVNVTSLSLFAADVKSVYVLLFLVVYAYMYLHTHIHKRQLRSWALDSQ